jgi:hypothetical protein
MAKTTKSKVKKVFIAVGFDAFNDGEVVVGWYDTKKGAVDNFRDSDGGKPLTVIEVSLPAVKSSVDAIPVTKVVVKGE